VPATTSGRHEVPDLQQPARAHGERLGELDEHEHASLRDPVGHGAAQEDGGEQAGRAGGRDGRELGGPAAQRHDLPHHRHRPDTGAQEGRRERGGEHPVLGMLGRPQGAGQGGHG